MANIRIEKSGLVNIIGSGLAVFPKETCGGAYGFINGFGDYVVTRALPYQQAKRTCRKIEVSSEEYKRLLWGPRNEDVLGDYHSHTVGKMSLSNCDLKDMEDHFNVYLLLNLRKTKKPMGFIHNKLGIYGDLSEPPEINGRDWNLRVMMKGYILDNGKIGKSKLKVAPLDVDEDVLREVFRI